MLSYISALGVVVPDAETVRRGVEDEFRQYLGLGDDWSFVPETILGRIIEAFTLQRLGTLGTNAYVAQQTNLNLATGVFLDALGALFLRSRTRGTRAEVQVKLVLNDATVLANSGQLIIDKDTNTATKIQGGLFFAASEGSTYYSAAPYERYVEENVKNAAGVLEKRKVVHAVLVAMTSGNKPQDATKDISLVSSCKYIESTEVVSVNSYGTDIESDAEFRRRLISSRWTGTSFCESIYSSLISIEGVRSVSVVENVTSTPKATPNSAGTDLEFLMSPHSVMITVEGGDTNAKAVAEAIFRTKSVGSVMVPCNEQFVAASDGDYTMELVPERASCAVRQIVTDEYFGRGHEVIFNVPYPVRVVAKICVSKNKYTGNEEELKTEMRAALHKWKNGDIESVEGLAVGSFVYGDEIASALTLEIPEIRIREVKLVREPEVGTSEADYNYLDKIPIMEWELAVIEEAEAIFDVSDNDV